MPRATKLPTAPVEGPLDVFAEAVAAEVVELEVADARYVPAIGGHLLEHNEGLVVSHPRLLHPTYNAVLSLSSTPESFVPFVASAEAHFQRKGAPFAVVTSPVSLPANAPEVLAARGYRRSSVRVWMELMESVPKTPDDPLIETRFTHDLDTWAQTVALAVGVEDQTEFLLELALSTVRAPRHRLVLATYRGRPAGACEVSADNAVAFVRHLGVIEAYRRKGIARALLAAASAATDELHVVRLAIRAFAGTGADRVFERYGFAGSHISEEWVRETPAFLMD